MKLIVLCIALAVANAASVSEQEKSPITKVVNLLEKLSEKLTEELKGEKDLYEKYHCWYKSIKDSKTSTNEAAQARIASLAAYIEDIEGGQIEYTSERQDFQKQIREVQSDIQTTDAVRTKEKDDFGAAVEEIQMAIAALDAAAAALQQGLTAFIQSRSPGYLKIKSELLMAVKLSQGKLSAEQTDMMTKLANGDVPAPMEVGSEEWKKVNRKATFKDTYESQSDQLYNTMISMKNTFMHELEHAQAKEEEHEVQFTKLMTTKQDMLTEANNGLSTLVEENGIRMKAKEEANEEKDALEEQITKDTEFINQVEAAHANKEQEFNQRREMRNNELNAISKAISVLHSDTSRDTFRSAYTEAHLASFLQIPCAEQRLQKATRAARAALLEVASTDERVSQIAKLIRQAPTHYTLGNATLDPRHPANGITLVVRYIDQLIQNLMEEESSDLAKKNQCEDDFAKSAQDARFQSLQVDELSEDMQRADSKIKDINAQIKDEQGAVDELKKELEAVQQQRDEEHAEHLRAASEDQQAVELIKKAMTTIENWMNGGEAASFVQLSQVARPEPVAKKPLALSSKTVHEHHQEAARAGAHQAPPPQTWAEGQYTGASSNADRNGILSILNLLKEDMEQDIRTAEAADTQAQTEFEAQKASIDASIQAGEDTISGYEQDRAAQEQLKNTKSESRRAKTDELAATVKEYQEFKPGCDFVLMNMEARWKKRTLEGDGLRKAKAILEGADMIAITPTTEYGGIRTGLIQKC